MEISKDELKALLCSGDADSEENSPTAPYDNGLVGEYVIVRCRDAGVHAGLLKSHHERQCVLSNARRLYRWFPAEGKWLTAVALNGLGPKSQVGPTSLRIHLTENCEIIECSSAARASIEGMPDA